MAGIAKTWQGLPVELLDMILEDTDSESRKACSLVCRDWLDVSQRHIFETTIVRSDTSFDAFLQFLTTHSHISHHIHNLYLLGPQDKHKSKQFPSIDLIRLVDIVASAPNILCVELKTVQLIDVPEDARSRLTSLQGPIQLTNLSLTSHPLGPRFDHCPLAIMQLLYLFEAEFMQVELSSWVPFPLLRAAGDYPAVKVPWHVHQPSLCLKKICQRRPSYLLDLTNFLVPGSLHRLHLAFDDWSHLDEMGRFLKHFGESITEFTITFGYALRHHERIKHYAPTEKEWESYGFSHLRNLSKLRFDLADSMIPPFEDEPTGWADTVGIPRFLACFPRDLPLRDGIVIDVQYVDDLIGGAHGIVTPRPEIEDALLRFDNLDRVVLCPRLDFGCERSEAIGAQAFPRLWEARMLVCMVELEVDECC